MKILFIVILFIAHSMCVELILPFTGSNSPVFKVKKSEAQIPSDQNVEIKCKVTNIESNGFNLITKIIFKGVKIFEDTKQGSPGFTRIVIHTDTGYYDTVVIIAGIYSGIIEESYYIRNGMIYNITNLKDTIDMVLQGCNKEYCERVRKVMKSMVPTIVFGKNLPYNGDRISLQLSAEAVQDDPIDESVSIDVNKIMSILEVRKIVEEAGPSGVAVKEDGRLVKNVEEYEPDSHSDTDTDSDTD